MVDAKAYCTRIGIALALAALLTACVEPTPERLMNDARVRSAQGDGAAAVIQTKQALALAPQDVQVLLEGGRIYTQAGELAEAEKALRSAQRLGAKPEIVLPLLGRAMLDREQYSKVLEIEPDPAWPAEARAAVAMLRGQAQLALHSYGNARVEFEQASAVLADDARTGLARVTAAQGDVPGAAQEIEQVIVAHPKSSAAWVLKGDLLRAQGRDDEAIKAYQNALAAAPTEINALLGLTTASMARRDYPAAHGNLAKALKVAPAHPLVHFNRAYLALQEGNYQICQEALQRVFAMVPEHGPGTLLTGALMHATGNYALATRALLGFLQRQPGSVMARKLIAATMLKTGQPRSAVYFLEPVLEAEPDAATLALAGQAYLELGQADKAQTLLERAVARDPQSVELRSGLGMARVAGGNEARGIVDLEAAVELKPDSSTANRFLVTALIGQNRLDQALEVVKRLEAALPASPETHQLKGAVYLARRDDASAEKSFRRALSINPGYFPAAAALAGARVLKKDRPGARAEIEKVLQADARNLDALLFLASMDLGEGKRADAIKRLGLCIEIHPRAVQAYAALGAVHLDSQQLVAALDVLQRAQQFSPADPKILELLGRVQSARADHRAAIDALSRLQTVLPRAPGPLLQLALAHSAAGEHPAAVKRVREAMQLAPDDVGVLTTYGLVLLQSGQYAEARKHALDMQGRFPKLAQGYALEGDALLAMQNYAAAARALEKADELAPSGALRVKLHQAALRSSGAPAAENRLLQWLKDYPADRITRHYLAHVYASSGRPQLAIEQYDILIKLDPSDYRALNSAALAFDRAGDARALDYAQQALKLNPEDPAVLDTVGWLLVGKGDLIRGLDLLRKSAKLAPDVPTVRFHLAFALARAGDSDRARRDLKELLASSKDFPEADEARALLKKLTQ